MRPAARPKNLPEKLPRLDVTIGLGILFVLAFVLCCIIGMKVGWAFNDLWPWGGESLPPTPMAVGKPPVPDRGKEVEVKVVATLEVGGCEYLVFSTGEICHKGDCKTCREWLLRSLAAQSAMENKTYGPGGDSGQPAGRADGR